MFIALVILILVIGILLYFFVQNHGMHSMIWNEVRELAEGSPVEPDSAADADDLPAPLRRYLSFAIDEGRSNAGFARLRHGGTFRLQPDADWLPIRGEEYFHASAPGFVWTGVVRPNPLAWVRARDKYIGGRGEMLIRLRGAVTLGRSAGPEMDRSSLLRYLAEMPWFPTAFRTVEGLQWTEVDAHTAEAVLTHAGETVTGRFTVGDTGEITGFTSQDRFREVDGKQVRTVWKGAYRNYREVDGMRVPHDVEVTWELEDGDFPYARFQVTGIEFDVPVPF
jgi:hypothetical protein